MWNPGCGCSAGEHVEVRLRLGERTRIRRTLRQAIQISADMRKLLRERHHSIRKEERRAGRAVRQGEMLPDSPAPGSHFAVSDAQGGPHLLPCLVYSQRIM